MKIINIINEEINNFLNEAKKAVDIWNRFYKNIKKDDFYKIIAADPTTDIENDKLGKFSKWLLTLYKKNELRFEDLYKATDYLKLFIKYKNVLDIKDIMKYQSLPHLYKELEKVMGELKSDTDIFTKEKAGGFIRKGEAELIYEDRDWLIIIPKTEKASIYFGSHTQWCTASTDPKRNQFENYSNNGYLFNLISKHNRKNDYLLFVPNLHTLTHEFEFADVNDDHSDNFNDVTHNNIDLFKTILSHTNGEYEYMTNVNYDSYYDLSKLKILNDNFYNESLSSNPIEKKIITTFLNDRMGESFSSFFIDLKYSTINRTLKEKIFNPDSKKLSNLIKEKDKKNILDLKKYKNNQEAFNYYMKNFHLVIEYIKKNNIDLYDNFVYPYSKSIVDKLYYHIKNNLFIEFENLLKNDDASYYFNLLHNEFIHSQDFTKNKIETGGFVISLPNNLYPTKEEYNNYLDNID